MQTREQPSLAAYASRALPAALLLFAASLAQRQPTPSHAQPEAAKIHLPLALAVGEPAPVPDPLSTVQPEPSAFPSPSPTATARPTSDGPATAWVWEHVDPWTERTGAAYLLEAAGFHVEPLPLDRSPREADVDLIFLGSFLSEDPAYAAYMASYADDLYHFVDRGHLLVQMTQADQTEAAPPFLPTTQRAHRIDLDFEEGFLLAPQHPLMDGIEADAEGRVVVRSDRDDVFWGPLTVWESFDDQGGFQVILSGDPDAQSPALMEGAYGQGRILLAAMAFDKVIMNDGSDRQSDEQRAFNGAFFPNLRQHALAVRDRNTEPLEITPPSGERPFTPGAWTLALLPDTQVYSLRNPGLFQVQTGWLRLQREARDIRYALHLGDIVNNNTALEWRRARDAMRLLDGVLPYALVPGNHDYGPSGDASTRETLLNEFFPGAEQETMPSLGGLMEPGKLDNSFHLFEAGGVRWIVIALEWGPRDGTIAWADGVMRAHSDRRGILVTHAYLNHNDRRYDITDTAHPQDYNPHHYRTPGGVNDGQELWDKLVRRHDFAFTFNGHVLADGTGYLESENVAGRRVHQMLVNYQMRPMGGEGYLRLLEFQPDGVHVQVKSYSPLFDRYLLDEDQSFTIEMDPPRPETQSSAPAVNGRSASAAAPRRPGSGEAGPR